MDAVATEMMPASVPPLLTLAVVMLLAVLTLAWLAGPAREWFSQPAPVEKDTVGWRDPLKMRASSEVLLDPARTLAVQGHTVPVAMDPAAGPGYELDPRKPPVDGTEAAPRSLAMFSFNKCSLDCCPGVGGYSCDKGCVCVSQEQRDFLAGGPGRARAAGK